MATKKRKRKRKGPQRSKSTLPEPWNWYSNGQLKACGLLRERQWIYAWDDANTIYLLDLSGELIAQRKVPDELVAVAASDIGATIVAVGKSSQVWWFDAELEPQLEISVTFEPLSIVTDPHGDYTAISSKHRDTLVCDRNGAKAGEFTTTRPLRYMAFIANSGHIIGAAENGLVACYDYTGEPEWETAQGSNVGGMAIDGDGQAVLLACFGHGLARYDANGEREGIYRFEHAPALVSSDFDGSSLLVATLEQTLIDLSFEGTVKAEKPLGSKPVAIAIDVLARYAIIGFPNGELQFIRLPDFFNQSETVTMAAAGTAVDGALGVSVDPQPKWDIKAAKNLDEVNSTVLEAVPGTSNIAVYSNRKSLRIYDTEGELYHESEGMPGVGRIIRTASSWLAAASDRFLVAYHPQKNESMSYRNASYEISHLELLESFGEALMVESCEYVSRISFPGDVVWKHHLDYNVESAAVLNNGSVVLALDDHSAVIYGPDGSVTGKYRPRQREPIQAVTLGDDWATIAAQSRTIRGHEPDGQIVWSIALPWAPWSVRKMGKYVLVTSPDGRSLLLNADGDIVTENKEKRDNARYFLRSNSKIGRLFCKGQTLMVSTFDGSLVWRYTDDHQIGPYAAGPTGVWVFLGRQLTYIPFKAQ